MGLCWNANLMSACFAMASSVSFEISQQTKFCTAHFYIQMASRHVCVNSYMSKEWELGGQHFTGDRTRKLFALLSWPFFGGGSWLTGGLRLFWSFYGNATFIVCLSKVFVLMLSQLSWSAARVWKEILQFLHIILWPFRWSSMLILMVDQQSTRFRINTIFHTSEVLQKADPIQNRMQSPDMNWNFLLAFNVFYFYYFWYGPSSDDIGDCARCRISYCRNGRQTVSSLNEVACGQRDDFFS